MMSKKSLYLFPENFMQVSDMNQILELIASSCFSIAAKKKALQPLLFTDCDQIKDAHIIIREAINMHRSGYALPALEFADNRTEILNLRTTGWVIDLENLHVLRNVLQLFSELLKFLSAKKQAEELKVMVMSIVFHDHLLIKINSILDHEGNIRDDASEELIRLSREYKKQTKEIEKRLHSIFTELKISGIAADDSNMTIRNGRSVIPVPVSYKNRIKGIIHDESATGQTAYVEPLEIVEMGNRLRENLAARQREILRILADISEQLHYAVDDITKYYEILTDVDLCFGKARFAGAYDCILPVVENKPVIDWKQARNIVLQVHLKKQNRKIIPLDIKLGDHQRMMVISGANAGGKSVVIKTVALIQTMIQCALPVPLKEESLAGVFSSIFLDMGDGQNMESDLSTYSSHLETMKVFISQVNSKSLYLIDEIGTGTDPVLGGSLAQAILIRLHQHQACGIITTHLDALKKMADETHEAQNAAMVFDTQRLEPSYVLKNGIPGNSFTFEIAARTGIPEEIIGDAKLLAGDERITFEQKISDMEEKTALLLESMEKQNMAEEFLDELIQKYQKLIEKFEKEQSVIIEKTRQEASEIISKTNKTIEKTIREIKESDADRNRTKQLREELKTIEEQAQNFEPSAKIPEKLLRNVMLVQKEKTEKQIKHTDWKNGMRVKHKTNGMEGIVLEVSGDNRVKVAFNSVSLSLPAELLVPLPEQQKKGIERKLKLQHDLHQKVGLFERQLDLRGMKAEEVMYVVEKHIDDALLIGICDFSILHGKGYGVLRNVSRQILSKHPNVESFQSEHVDRGGDGITIVKLRKT
jgi:DNA mismatch repair protein MutS2